MLEDQTDVEIKMIQKYYADVDKELATGLFEVYRNGPAVYEPIRTKLSEAVRNQVFEHIDSSNSLTSSEKFFAIFGFVMILDGIVPSDEIMMLLRIVLGNGFYEAIMRHR
jgi:hypothetical protein